ncbi:MAG: cupredoxin domain-containing protein [Thermoplasmata archaeon]
MDGIDGRRFVLDAIVRSPMTGRHDRAARARVLRAPPRRTIVPFLAVAAVIGLSAVIGPVEGASVLGATPTSAGIEFINVSATGQLAFSPSQFTVPPGATVHLTVLQLSNFAHTFTLSPAANVTIPASDNASQLTQFFHAHPPIVNLSMGSTPNVPYSVTFTAPSPGTYEFVCLIHFANGMVGEMTTSNGGTSSESTIGLPYVLILAAVVVVVVVGAFAVAWRRRARP